MWKCLESSWWWWRGGVVGWETPIIIITLHLVELSWVELRVDQYNFHPFLKNINNAIIIMFFKKNEGKKLTLVSGKEKWCELKNNWSSSSHVKLKKKNIQPALKLPLSYCMEIIKEFSDMKISCYLLKSLFLP